MPRKNERAIVTKHLSVYEEDWEFLVEQLQRQAGLKLTPGMIIKEIVHNHVKVMRSKQSKSLDSATIPERFLPERLMRGLEEIASRKLPPAAELNDSEIDEDLEQQTRL